MRCKNCKEKFEPIRFNQKFCFKPECLNLWVETEKAKQWVKEKAKRKASIQTRTELLKLAQITFNAYIRKRDVNEPCISCGTQTGKMNAGHYYSAGGHSNVRFDEYNVWKQCEYCNNHLSGNLILYGVNLEKKIGNIEFILLRERAYDVKKWTLEEIKEITTKYKLKIKDDK